MSATVRDPEIRDRAHRASDLLPTDPCTTPAEYWAHNYAACWFSVVGDHRHAVRHFAVLRGACTEFPWLDVAPYPAQAFRMYQFRQRFKKFLRLPARGCP